MNTVIPAPAGATIAGSRFRPGRRCAGLTLVELLVTLTVMSILASLTLSGLLVARTRAKVARTATTIRKISEVILPYYEQYETRRPAIDPALTTTLLSAPSGRAKYVELKQLAIRRLMTLELPERTRDVAVAESQAKDLFWSGSVQGSAVTLSEVPPVARRYQSLITADRSKVGNWDGGELLYMIVTRGPAADPDVISHFRDDEVGDPDRDGLVEFIDGWGRGINFKRWPIGFVSPMQPIDGTARSIESLLSKNGHRLVPLIYSAGPDGEYSIDEMPDLAYGGPGAAYDPFAYDKARERSLVADPEHPASSATGPAVVLVPVVRPGDGPVTFVASQAGKPIVDSVEGFPTVPDAAFQTVGSVTGPGASDNIHNHDLTR